MKQLIKNIAVFIVGVYRVVYSYKTHQKIRAWHNKLYTLWLSKEFNSIGRGTCICSPMYLEGGRFISIGDNFWCDNRLRLDAFDEFSGGKFTPEIIIGNNVSIQKDCHIGAISKITIGNNVLLASKVYISDHSHGKIDLEALSLPPAERQLYSKGEIVIEDNVWLGEGVVVLSGVTIGRNSIVGANSVVTKSMPQNSVVAGSPARVIKKL